MSPSFAGVSIIADGKLSTTTSAVDASTGCGYDLLLVQGYSRTNEEVPTGKTISTAPFVVGGHRWYIAYGPNGREIPECADFISIYLCHLPVPEVPVEAQFVFSFVDEVEEQTPMCIRATGPTCIFSGENPCWGYDKFVTRDALERSANLKGDCFTIRCDIMVLSDPNASTDSTMPDDIGQHFNNLLENKVGADVTFKVSGETFVAHRCVLAARSTVFMAQLFGPMKEGTTSCVIHIKHIEANVFKSLLTFIYTGVCLFVEEDRAHAVVECDEEKDMERVLCLQNLLVAADIYDLQRLKLMCEVRLSQHIGVSSVVFTLTLAEQHYCHGLKEACFKFIQVLSPPCLQEVMANDGWEHMRTTYPSLMNEIAIKLPSSLKDKKRKQ